MQNEDRARYQCLLNHDLCKFIKLSPCPVDSKNRRFEELFVGVLLANILLVEIFFGQFVNQEFVSWNKIFLCETGVDNKCLILEMAN